MEIRLVASCDQDEFQCGDGACHYKGWVCDGYIDCPDGSDENPDACPPPNICPSDEFPCDVFNCISKTSVCDEEFDCHDGADEENCPPRNCTDDEFKCDNGECIHVSWYCDGLQECDDGSDETKCGWECKADQFTCSNDDCVDAAQYCDGIPDCQDGEDELLCFKDSRQYESVCLPDEFDCCNMESEAWDVQCIDQTAVCDGVEDCTRTGYDEDPEVCHNRTLLPCNRNFSCDSGKCIAKGKVCNSNEDCPNNADKLHCAVTCESMECSHRCVMYGNGAKCLCKEGYRLVDQTFCEDFNECDERNGGCNQHCYNTKGGHQCTCAPGYRKIKDDHICLAAGVRPRLYVTTPSVLLQLTTDGSTVVSQAVNAAEFHQHTDVNAHTGEVFWLHRQTGQESTEVYRSAEGKSKPIIQNLGPVGGIAVDWITGNVYLTEDNHILIYGKTGRHAVLHRHRSSLGELVVHPAKGLLYWIVEGDLANLMTSWMNGQHAKSLHIFDVPAGSSALSLDPATERLYVKRFTSDIIFSVNIDGTNRQMYEFGHVKTLNRLMNRLDVFEGIAYMTSMVKNSLMLLHTFDHRQGFVHTVHDIRRPTSVKVMHILKQPSGENPCAGRSCMYLCLIVPGGARCVCPEDMQAQQNTCNGSQSSAATNKGNWSQLLCDNGGTRVISENITYCSCSPQFSGPLCQEDRGSILGEVEAKSLTWIVGVIAGIMFLTAGIVTGVYYSKWKRDRPSLIRVIKFQNPSLSIYNKDDKEELVPEISFGNPGIGDEIEVGSDEDWWKRLLQRSRVSMDSDNEQNNNTISDNPDLQIPRVTGIGDQRNLKSSYGKIRLLK